MGIQVGTAVATLVRKADHAPASGSGFRQLRGRRKREELAATAEAEPDGLYELVEPILPLGLPFARTAVSPDWFDWPALPELLPVSFPGVKTSRDGFLVDTDLDRLKARIADYFDPSLGHDEIARRHPAAMQTTAQFDTRAVREALLARDKAGGVGEFVRFAYRPFDNRWLYWEGARARQSRRRRRIRSLRLSAVRQPVAVLGRRWRSRRPSTSGKPRLRRLEKKRTSVQNKLRRRSCQSRTQYSTRRSRTQGKPSHAVLVRMNDHDRALFEGRSMFAQDADERPRRVVGQNAVRAERYDARSRAVGEGDQSGEIEVVQ